MSYLGLFFVLQCILLQNAFALPFQGLGNNQLLGNFGFNQGFNQLNLGNNLVSGLGGLSETTVISGTVSQAVSPSYNPGWQLTASQAPLVTEIVPSLQFGEISLGGDLPIGGTIKISGTFPVYGYVGVDGAVPSYGTAYVDTGNGLVDFCKCGL